MSASSRSLLTGESEPWKPFRVSPRPYLERRHDGFSYFALYAFVGPSMARQRVIALGPYNASASDGPLVMPSMSLS